MRQSKLFTKTQKNFPSDEKSLNAQLLIRGGFVQKEMAGVYSFLPLGLLILEKIINIIRREMKAIGGQEVLLSALQNPELWKKSGRWDDQVINVWFKAKVQGGGETGLGTTHEEPLTNLLKQHLTSYKDLPLYVYQFQTKFRNEVRAKSGLLRTREFIMKDLYSFSRTKEELDDFYEKVKEAYNKIFRQVGLGQKTHLTFASGGSFSKYSHEFQTVCQAGEDLIYICQNCNLAINKEIKSEVPECPGCKSGDFREEKAVETGNIFKLGTKFSKALGLEYKDKEGQKQPAVMGCYGIGPGRAMGAVVETYNDKKGIIWPENIAPFKIHLLCLGETKKEAEKFYQSLQKQNFEVLFDDRKLSPGEKFADADLVGLPYRLVVSEKTLKEDSIELKKRNEEKEELVKISDLAKRIT